MYTKKQIWETFFIAIALFIAASACHKQQEKVVSAEKLTEDRCSTCHFSMDVVYNKVKTPQQWDETVTRMYKINPDLISPEESRIIISYLQSLPPRAAKNLDDK